MAIFAEQLVLILRDHGLSMSSLDNPPFSIHPEKIRRIRASLSESSKVFTVLNPEELSRIENSVPFTQAEHIRLRAAILTSPIEVELSKFNVRIALAEYLSKLAFADAQAKLYPSKDPPRVFVSHSSEDADFVVQLVADMKQAGALVWVDFEKIEQGDFMKRINEGLRESEWMILVVSPAALKSEAVEMEVNAALEMVRHHEFKGVIPFVIAQFQPEQMPPVWRPLHRYDATQDYNAALKDMLKALGL